MNCGSKVTTGVVAFGYKLSVCMKVPILGIPYKWDNTFAFFMIGSFHLVKIFSYFSLCQHFHIFKPNTVPFYICPAFFSSTLWWTLGSFRLLTIVNMSCQYPRLCLQCFGGLK